jgi:hypothetical protein
LGAELGHARGDAVLRNDCEGEHGNHGDDGGLHEYFRRAREGEAGYKVEHAGDYAEVVEAPESDADDCAGLVTALECCEEGWSDGDAEIDDRAEPGAEREKLDEAEDVGHVPIYLAAEAITGFLRLAGASTGFEIRIKKIIEMRKRCFAGKHNEEATPIGGLRD